MLESEMIIKILLTILLSSIIGLEREIRKKPAGLRTHIIIGLTACLYTIVSIDYFPQDNARIIANILTGMGFIGAGTIISFGNKIVGITTAATLWFITSIGVLVGLGFYLLATISTILVLFILLVFKEFEREVIRSHL